MPSALEGLQRGGVWDNVNVQGVVRVLKPGQQANIWLELVMPEENGDVFQVRRPDARSTQSCEDSRGRSCCAWASLHRKEMTGSRA